MDMKVILDVPLLNCKVILLAIHFINGQGYGRRVCLCLGFVLVHYGLCIQCVCVCVCDIENGR